MNSETPLIEPSDPRPRGTPDPVNDPVSPASLGARLFQWRDFTPVPLVLIMLVVSDPTALSATLGVALMVVGEMVRIYGVAFIGSVSRTRNIETTGQDLITNGPFAIVRNPLYLGNLFLATGFATYSGHPWFVALTLIGFSFQYYCIVKFEETLLIERFGAAYKAYMEQVPAWIPSALPDLESWEWPKEIAPAIRSERKTLGAIVALLVVIHLFN